jgi:hypothetical protein
VIDQYQVSTGQRSGITNDPNTRSTPHANPLPVRGGEGTGPEYIVRLLGQIIMVSVGHGVLRSAAPYRVGTVTFAVPVTLFPAASLDSTVIV